MPSTHVTQNLAQAGQSARALRAGSAVFCLLAAAGVALVPAFGQPVWLGGSVAGVALAVAHHLALEAAALSEPALVWEPIS